jgi:hypothetical protein
VRRGPRSYVLVRCPGAAFGPPPRFRRMRSPFLTRALIDAFTVSACRPVCRASVAVLGQMCVPCAVMWLVAITRISRSVGVASSFVNVAISSVTRTLENVRECRGVPS